MLKVIAIAFIVLVVLVLFGMMFFIRHHSNIRNNHVVEFQAKNNAKLTNHKLEL